VAHFSENLLPFLAEHCEIKLFTDAYPPSPTPILKNFEALHMTDLTPLSSSFDAVLYHMGNHWRYHKNVFQALCRVPGLVLLHDCVLHHFFSRYIAECGKFKAFRNLLEFCYPGSGEQIASFFKGKGDPYTFPMPGIVARLARGTIVTNEYGRNIVLKDAPGAKVKKINHPYFPSDINTGTAHAIRQKFNIPESCFVLSSVGHLTPTKRIDVAIEAFCRFHKRFPNSVFLLAGEISAQLPLMEMISKSPSKNIEYLGYLNDAEFDGLMQLADVFINLRYPSNGETSGTLLHMLGRGKVAVVSDYAQFAELPDKICVKIALGPDEASELAGQLFSLAGDKKRRARIGAAAREYVEHNHTREDAAKAIINFANEVSTAEPMLPRTEIDNLMRCDGFVRRAYHLSLYNTRQLFSLFRAHGLAPMIRRGARRVFPGKH